MRSPFRLTGLPLLLLLETGGDSWAQSMTVTLIP
jgi:hypothetical protein